MSHLFDLTCMQMASQLLQIVAYSDCLKVNWVDAILGHKMFVVLKWLWCSRNSNPYFESCGDLWQVCQSHALTKRRGSKNIWNREYLCEGEASCPEVHSLEQELIPHTA